MTRSTKFVRNEAEGYLEIQCYAGPLLAGAFRIDRRMLMDKPRATNARIRTFDDAQNEARRFAHAWNDESASWEEIRRDLRRTFTPGYER